MMSDRCVGNGLPVATAPSDRSSVQDEVQKSGYRVPLMDPFGEKESAFAGSNAIRLFDSFAMLSRIFLVRIPATNG